MCKKLTSVSILRWHSEFPIPLGEDNLLKLLKISLKCFGLFSSKFPFSFAQGNSTYSPWCVLLHTLHAFAECQVGYGGFSGNCQACFADTYKDITGDGLCQSCPVGTTTMQQTGQSACGEFSCAPLIGISFQLDFFWLDSFLKWCVFFGHAADICRYFSHVLLTLFWIKQIWVGVRHDSKLNSASGTVFSCSCLRDVCFIV